MAGVTYHIGTMETYNSRGTKLNAPAYINIEIRGKRFTFEGRCSENMFRERPTLKSYAPGFDKETVDELLRLCNYWHLNDLRPGCEHQRTLHRAGVDEWNKDKVLTLIEYKWTEDYLNKSSLARRGELSQRKYAAYQKEAKIVKRATLARHPDNEDVALALENGWIKEESREEKVAHWVGFREHPEGLLSRPCPTCGYKYGTQWVLEPLTNEPIQWLNDLTQKVDEALGER